MRLTAMFAVGLCVPVLAAAAPENGASQFEARCAACHGAQAQGTPGLAPPLAGRLPGSARRQVVLTLLNGLSGEIAAGTESYDGVMPSFAGVSDGDLAVIVNYLLSLTISTNHGVGTSVTSQDIADARREVVTAAMLRERRHSELRDASAAP